ncbi:MAG: STAS domain-containing protein [Thiotrichaceae bacterium]|nr:STAS domain-containing protein [Thiotrichaceae bacterium]
MTIIKPTLTKTTSVKNALIKKPVVNRDVVSEIEDKYLNESNNNNPAYGFFNSSELSNSQSVEFDSTENHINLGTELTIRSVSACKELIDRAILNGFDVKLAAGDLQKIDVAGLQLIYSLNKTLKKTSQTINWVSCNSIINEASQLIGMPLTIESPEGNGAYGFFNQEEDSKLQTDQQENSAYGFF